MSIRCGTVRDVAELATRGITVGDAHIQHHGSKSQKKTAQRLPLLLLQFELEMLFDLGIMNKMEIKKTGLSLSIGMC